MSNPVCEPEAALFEMKTTVERGLVAQGYGTVWETSWLRWCAKGVIPLSVTTTILKL